MEQVIKELQLKDRYEQLLTEYVNELRDRSNKEKLKEFSLFRDFSLEVIEESGIFYVGDMVEMLLPQYIDMLEDFGVISPANKKPIFSNRYVIPIKNEKGLVQNLVGYSAQANERYIYGTSKYYRRKDTLWGLENLKLAYELGYAILTEGITDAIRIRDLGYKNAFAMCGTHKSDYIIRQLNRCRHGIIKIPDRDEAGQRALKGWDFNRSITIYINLQYKDIDEMCRNSVGNKEWFKEYLEECIKWIKSDVHRGYKNISESVTIL